MGGEYAHPGHPRARQAVPWHGQLVREDAGGGGDLRTIEKRQGPVELGRVPGSGQLLVGWERRPKSPSHEGRIRPLLLRADRPEIETRGCGYRWTSARARHGLPDPLTSFSGATTRTAP